MVDSQQDAIAAALVELGYDFPREVTVAGVLDDSPADGRARGGRRHRRPSNGTAVELASTSCARRSRENGADEPGEARASCATASSRPSQVTPVERDGTAVLGVGVRMDYEFPIDVETPARQRRRSERRHDVRARHHRQADPRRHDRRRDRRGHRHDRLGGRGRRRSAASGRSCRARWMRAPTGSSHPQSNCDEVTGHVPDGLTVFAVSTLDEALHDRGGDRRRRADTSGFASCPREPEQPFPKDRDPRMESRSHSDRT